MKRQHESEITELKQELFTLSVKVKILSLHWFRGLSFAAVAERS